MSLYITKSSFYQPSLENPSEMPKLEYCDPLFKRRLSQISRMTIEALHGLGDEVLDSKLVFASFRGEIARQLKMNKMLVEDQDVMPAAFSISVFNTPAAAATIALKMKSGYTCVYPSEDNFKSAFISAAAPVLCGDEKKIVFAYADELVPEEYKNCAGYTDKLPLAFAVVLSSQKSENAVEITLDSPELASPDAFLEILKKVC
ncbi:MAG: beta-ketoacyl synthase chain length factor [Treponema sp.]|nr:beta-ketoacyl synthase chain length factor [Candidatus Treponema equifaecale]